MYNFDGIIKILQCELENKQSNSLLFYLIDKEYNVVRNLGSVYIKTEDGLKFLQNNMHLLSENERERFRNKVKEAEIIKEKKENMIKEWIVVLQNNNSITQDLLSTIFFSYRSTFRQFCDDNNLVIAYIAPKPVITKYREDIKYKKKVEHFHEFEKFPLG